jgi:hypothetical protein
MADATLAMTGAITRQTRALSTLLAMTRERRHCDALRAEAIQREGGCAFRALVGKPPHHCRAPLRSKAFGFSATPQNVGMEFALSKPCSGL